ncbi:MAG: tetratricopeptide repeat protein [Gammaproteobacteria bacterium]|nr:tetratricopeptide repeat protein [Gammaproteobacteria bacterium]
MLTWNYSKTLTLVIGLLLLAACSSTPGPGPAPAPEATQAPASDGGQADAQDVPADTPEPVDFNQRAYLEAIASLKNGNVDQALDLLLEVSREAPDKPYIFTNIGLAYLKLEQPGKAEQAFLDALEQDDRDAVAHNHLGILLRQQGNFAEALRHYRRAIQIDDEYAPAYLNLGILYDLYLQDLEKALRHYETYLSLTGEENPQVTGWITDIQRQLKSAGAQSQG